MSESPLARLIKKKDELDLETQAKLANSLEPFVYLDPENLGVHFKPEAQKLTTLQKVWVYLLARKAITLLNPDASELATPTEVEESTKLSGGTVRPKLTELVSRRWAQKINKTYTVSPYFISDAEKVIESTQEESKSNEE